MSTDLKNLNVLIYDVEEFDEYAFASPDNLKHYPVAGRSLMQSVIVRLCSRKDLEEPLDLLKRCLEATEDEDKYTRVFVSILHGAFVYDNVSALKLLLEDTHREKVVEEGTTVYGPERPARAWGVYNILRDRVKHVSDIYTWVAQGCYYNAHRCFALLRKSVEGWPFYSLVDTFVENQSAGFYHPLFFCCVTDAAETLELLLEYRTNLDRTIEEYHLYHVACRYGSINCLRVMAKKIEEGVLPRFYVEDNSAQSHLFSPLSPPRLIWLCCRYGRTECLRLLLDHFDYRKTAAKFEELALDDTSREGTRLIRDGTGHPVEYLYGPRTTKETRSGRFQIYNTAYHEAVKGGHTDCIRLLVRKFRSCGLGERDTEGHTAFSLAVKLGNREAYTLIASRIYVSGNLLDLDTTPQTVPQPKLCSYDPYVHHIILSSARLDKFIGCHDLDM